MAKDKERCCATQFRFYSKANEYPGAWYAHSLEISVYC